MGISQRLTSHPATIGETYLTHLKFAMNVASTLIRTGFACLIHGIYPPVFENITSQRIKDLALQIEDRSSITDSSDISEVDTMAR
tara:strand:- start:620 stop:874 length:255 start_codon:yes stop_codon:yes gene_type:complete